MSSVHRDVFKIKAQNNSVRFGARFLEADGLEEKWSGEIPEIPEIAKNQLIGRVITNSEGKEYKLNRISEGNPDDENNSHHKCFWIESTQS